MKPDFKRFMLNEETVVMTKMPSDLSPYIAFLNRIIIKMIREELTQFCLDIKNARVFFLDKAGQEKAFTLPDNLDPFRLMNRIKIFGLIAISGSDAVQENTITQMIGHDSYRFEVCSEVDEQLEQIRISILEDS